MNSQRVGRPGLLSRMVLALCLGLGGCQNTGDALADPVEVVIPEGAAFGEVLDSLVTRGVVTRPLLFEAYARWRGDDARIRAGRYALVAGSPWGALLDDLVAGRVLTEPVTFPEGWTLSQMAPRIAEFTGVSEDSVRTLLTADSAHVTLQVPGPGLEGYLMPETYRFAAGLSPQAVIEAMAAEHRGFWTVERRARLDSLGLTQGELTTLASIVQAEARKFDEMPRIAGVYHNRLREGWLLQADPTVIYALGGYRRRLLFAAIDSVADSPYNTYTQPGLPPGPIGAPGRAALEAALYPEKHKFFFFVAHSDGSHVFTRSLSEHNRAIAEVRRTAPASQR